MNETIKKLMETYNITEQEAIDLHEYDTKHTRNDKEAMKYLSENGVAQKDLEVMFPGFLAVAVSGERAYHHPVGCGENLG